MNKRNRYLLKSSQIQSRCYQVTVLITTTSMNKTVDISIVTTRSYQAVSCDSDLPYLSSPRVISDFPEHWSGIGIIKILFQWKSHVLQICSGRGCNTTRIFQFWGVGYSSVMKNRSLL